MRDAYLFDFAVLDEATRLFLEQQADAIHGLLTHTTDHVLRIGVDARMIQHHVVAFDARRFANRGCPLSRATPATRMTCAAHSQVRTP